MAKSFKEPSHGVSKTPGKRGLAGARRTEEPYYAVEWQGGVRDPLAKKKRHRGLPREALLGPERQNHRIPVGSCGWIGD